MSLFNPDDSRMNLLSMKAEYMCNRTVYPDLLVNDLDFWLEANIFQKQVDQYLEQENRGSMPCNKHLFKKMNLISSCYLKSHIPPNIRINTRTVQEIFTIQVYQKCFLSQIVPVIIKWLRQQLCAAKTSTSQIDLSFMISLYSFSQYLFSIGQDFVIRSMPTQCAEIVGDTSVQTF